MYIDTNGKIEALETRLDAILQDTATKVHQLEKYMHSWLDAVNCEQQLLESEREKNKEVHQRHQNQWRWHGAAGSTERTESWQWSSEQASQTVFEDKRNLPAEKN